jgi:hypothetical protein
MQLGNRGLPHTRLGSSGNSMTTALTSLQSWFASECNGDWEHQFGVRIETSDNPGWIVEIDLADTVLDGVEFVPIHRPSGENDFLFCMVEGRKFKASAGGPNSLVTVLTVFEQWWRSSTANPTKGSP